MKKVLFYVASLLICCVACQEKENLPLDEEPIKITASFASADSRVSYEEDPVTHKLHQTWEVGDLLYGFDEDNNAICLRVASVDGSGVATLSVKSGALPIDGKHIHFIYAPGAWTLWEAGFDEFKEGEIPGIAFLGSQGVATASTVPALLTADAVVSGSSVNLVFANQTAVLGIKGFHGLPAGASVTRFEVQGVIALAYLSVEDNKLKITTDPGYMGVSVAKDGAWTADASGNVNDVFYVAAYPNAVSTDIALVANLSDGSQYVNELGSKTISVAKYYYMNDKALSKATVSVDLIGYGASWTPYSSLAAAVSAVNASAENGSATIKLLEDCTLSSPLQLTNTTYSNIYVNLNGHTLTLNENYIEMATSGAHVSFGNGEIVQSTSGSYMLDVSNGSVDLFEVSLRSSSDTPILNMTGGEVWVYEALLEHSGAGARVITCAGGTLTITDWALIKHTSATGGSLLYIPSGTPTVYIEGDASFVQAGTGTPLYVDSGVSGGEIRVRVNGAYFHTASTQTLYSVNSGIILVEAAHFNKENPCMNCTIAPNRTVGKILPVVVHDELTYNRRIIGNKAAYNSTSEAFISYSVAADRRLYPAKTNITYTPSTATWAFRSSHEGYSTVYDADLISLFTWGYDPVWSITPDGTTYLTGLTAGTDFDPERDWGSVMNAGACRVPTKDEWVYLLNERSASTVNDISDARFLKCKYQDTYGLLLFPDDFSWPAGAPQAETIVGSAINSATDQYSVTLYRATGNALIAAGCVFLPVEGYRNGTTIKTTSGNYWSSTARDNDEAYFLTFYKENLSPESYSGSDYTGQSVRLFFE